MAFTLTIPTHLHGRNPIVGRYTARELVPVVAGIFGAAGMMGHHHLAPAERLAGALVALALGFVLGLVRPHGRSLPAWGRLATVHLFSDRCFAWAPSPMPRDAAPPPGALRPPHLAPARATAEPASAPSASRGVPPRPRPAAARPPATQRCAFVPREISDGVIRFADGHMCAVLECSGVTTETLDTEQLRALHAAYHAFLLGLTFPVQVLLCADPVDLSRYAERRQERLVAGAPAVRRLGSADSAYMRRAIARLGALEQHVYVVIPAAVVPGPIGAPGAGLHALLRRRRPVGELAAARDQDDVALVLEDRCDYVRDGLARCGVHAWRLDTAALHALYYRRLCPRTARLQPVDPGQAARPAWPHLLFAPQHVDISEDADAPLVQAS